MSYEFIGMIVGFITIILTMVNLINQMRNEFNNKFDRLEKKQDDNFKTLLNKIDAVNARLDNLYHELFKKAA